MTAAIIVSLCVLNVVLVLIAYRQGWRRGVTETRELTSEKISAATHTFWTEHRDDADRRAVAAFLTHLTTVGDNEESPVEIEEEMDDDGQE